MPEERKSSMAKEEVATENGTNSPSKNHLSKGKMAIAKVTLLDGTVKDFDIEVSLQECPSERETHEMPFFQRKAKGKDLLDMICQSMNLLEKDYFGLVYENKYDTRNWLDKEKRIIKFLKSAYA